VGRLRRSFNTIKQDIEREIGADEIRRQLRNEAIMEKFKQARTQVTDAVNTVKKETEELRKAADLESQTASMLGNKPAEPGQADTATGQADNKATTAAASQAPAATESDSAPTND